MTKKLKTTPFGYHINRKYKDSLFRLLFSEKEGALELYNALNGSSYEDPDILEITTIDDVIYMGIKNDLSFLVEGKMHLLEEQSSWSENMPLRGLFYFSNLYQSYVEKNQLNIYSSKRLPLPQPSTSSSTLVQTGCPSKYPCGCQIPLKRPTHTMSLL